MGYFIEGTPNEEILLMIAKELGGRPPDWDEADPDFANRIKRANYAGAEMQWTYDNLMPHNGPAFIYINGTESMYRDKDFIRLLDLGSSHSYHGIYLKRDGWDRVEELLAAGKRYPTDDEVEDYKQRAHNWIALDHKCKNIRIIRPESFWVRLGIRLGILK